ncbi:MAG: hypothetical protein B6I36_02300 [Desulfobacteraceae bacterium 4572_35.1]|nr:MAG: hypothetical protein B6I36_02300 [Desulfobacteraceae bacterium 4572_35.1]
MKNWLFVRLLKYVAKKLDGYKTIFGGVGLILSGIAGLIGLMWPDSNLPPMELEQAIASISAGLVAIGLGHKGDKLTTAIKGNHSEQ